MTAAKDKSAALAPIVAAGGIVLRGRKKPLIAVVQLRQQKTWVLPKGKLHKNETVLAAAKREAVEETGRDVVLHEYLGQIAYTSGGLPKLAKFWRMEARGKPGRLMRDVQSVQWLPLNKAIAKLSRPRERKFLQRVGPRALAAAARGEVRTSRFTRQFDWFSRYVKLPKFLRYLLQR
jgi:8-oxo-dGTP diphosphatase